MSCTDRHALVGWADAIEEQVKSVQPVWGQLQGFPHRVHIQTKDAFVRAPSHITLESS